jgi:hypothetical protein
MSPAVATLRPEEIAAGILKGYQDFIDQTERRSRGGSREYVYASSWRVCTRQMSLEMIEPEKLPEFSVNTLANLRRGKDRERDLLADFTRAGRNSTPPFEVVGREERFELKDKKGRVVIVGKVDARLKVGRSAHPLEVKSWNPNLVARVKEFGDLFENRWTRSGAHQMLSYLFGANEKLGFFLLDRNGLPLLLPVELEKFLDRMEDFLSRSEVALDARDRIVKAGGDPKKYLPPFVDDPMECKYCGFSCNPPSYEPGADLVIDPEWIQKVERWALLEESGDEFAVLDKEIKEHFRGIEVALAGGFILQGRWQRDTKYIIPEKVKAEIAKLKAPFAEKVEKGKFFLEITKL